MLLVARAVLFLLRRINLCRHERAALYLTGMFLKIRELFKEICYLRLIRLMPQVSSIK